MAKSESLDPELIRHIQGILVCAANAFAATLIWLGYVSDGFTARALLDGIYEIQAGALAGCSLAITPGPLDVFYHDVILYWGNYFFYWGLFPSAVLLALKAVVGSPGAHYVFVFGTFFSLIFFLQLLILEILESSVTDKSLSDLSKYLGSSFLTWLLLFCIPYPAKFGWFFGRFVVYEQQILFGLAFAMPGVYCLAKGIKSKSIAFMATAVTLFSIGAWTRVTWFPFAWLAMLLSLIFMVRWSHEKGVSDRLAQAAMVIGPGLVLLTGLMVVNYIRFDSPFDFGVRYQNPAHYVYFRNLKMFFSPATMICNCVFNVYSYFCPPQWAEALGLYQNAFARYEGFPPSFFFLNPQFLPMLVLIPLGIRKAIKERSPLIVTMLVLVVTVVYLNIIIGLFGTIVIMRYFMEFYYFLILLVLAALLMFLRPAWCILIVTLSLMLYIPGFFNGILFSRPELRTVLGWPEANTLKVQAGRTPFVEPQAKWPEKRLSVENLESLPDYAVMGVNKGRGGGLLGKDIFCVYLIPGDMQSLPSQATVTIGGLGATGQAGKATFFLENRPLGSVDLSKGQTKDIDFLLPFLIPRRGPYQIMGTFFPTGESYLRPRPTGESVITFREIRLQAHAPREATSARP